MALTAAGPTALAQKMYKCPDGAGGTTFQQQPCPETPKEAEARQKEKERLEAEAARKKEDDARKKEEAALKAKERDKAYQEQQAERAAALKKQQDAQKGLMQGTSREATADGSLSAGTEQVYPAPWKEDAHDGIKATLAKKAISGCGKFRYRARGGKASSDFLVQCQGPGTKWTSYFVWPSTDSVKGPYSAL